MREFLKINQFIHPSPKAIIHTYQVISSIIRVKVGLTLLIDKHETNAGMDNDKKTTVICEFKAHHINEENIGFSF